MNVSFVLVSFVMAGTPLCQPYDEAGDFVALSKKLHSKSSDERYSATIVLRKMGRVPPNMIANIAHAYLSEEEFRVVRELQAILLANQDLAIQAMIKHVRDEQETRWRRIGAMFFLELCNQNLDQITTNLDKCLKDRDKYVAIRAGIYVLEKSPGNQNAINVLYESLKADREKTYLKNLVARSLARTAKCDIAVPYLLESLFGDHMLIQKKGERIQMTEARIDQSKDNIFHLWYTNDPMSNHVKRLRGLFLETKSDLRTNSDLSVFYAAWLYSLERKHKTEIDEQLRIHLIRSIKRVSEQYESPFALMFISVTGELGADAKTLMPSLEKLMNSTNGEIRNAASHAISKVMKAH